MGTTKVQIDETLNFIRLAYRTIGERLLKGAEISQKHHCGPHPQHE